METLPDEVLSLIVACINEKNLKLLSHINQLNLRFHSITESLFIFRVLKKWKIENLTELYKFYNHISLPTPIFKRCLRWFAWQKESEVQNELAQFPHFAKIHFHVFVGNNEKALELYFKKHFQETDNDQSLFYSKKNGIVWEDCEEEEEEEEEEVEKNLNFFNFLIMVGSADNIDLYEKLISFTRPPPSILNGKEIEKFISLTIRSNSFNMFKKLIEWGESFMNSTCIKYCENHIWSIIPLIISASSDYSFLIYFFQKFFYMFDDYNVLDWLKFLDKYDKRKNGIFGEKHNRHVFLQFIFETTKNRIDWGELSWNNDKEEEEEEYEKTFILTGYFKYLCHSEDVQSLDMLVENIPNLIGNHFKQKIILSTPIIHTTFVYDKFNSFLFLLRNYNLCKLPNSEMNYLEKLGKFIS